MTDAVLKIQKSYRRMYEGMIQKNAMILDEVLDESFVLIHMTGKRQNKQQFIQAVIDGTLNYDTAKHEQISVQHFDDTKAQLDGRTIVDASVFGSGTYTWHLRQVCRLRKVNEQWKMTLAQASIY